MSMQKVEALIIAITRVGIENFSPSSQHWGGLDTREFQEEEKRIP